MTAAYAALRVSAGYLIAAPLHLEMSSSSFSFSLSALWALQASIDLYELLLSSRMTALGFTHEFVAARIDEGVLEALQRRTVCGVPISCKAPLAPQSSLF